MSSRYWNKSIVKVPNVECTAVRVGQGKECPKIEGDSAYDSCEFIISRAGRIHNIKKPSSL